MAATEQPPASAAAPAAPSPPAPTPAATDVPRLASDIELIGRFEDSGFKEPPYIARRGDGQVVQLAPLLYALAEEIDGRRDVAQIAEAVSHRVQRDVTPDIVEMLLDEQLRRLGIVALRDGATAEIQKVDPLLGLKFRTKVVPAGFVRVLTTFFRPLFHRPVMVVVILGLLGLDAWLLGMHGISQGLRHVLYEPALLLLLIGGVVLATAFHEIGHATGVRYGGAEPGVMGVGVYIVWPAFYTDITDAYRLGKWGRLRADIGGMYFNAVFALCVAAVYAVTGFEPLLLLVLLQNFAIIQQSLPLLRLDGYYIISDLTGVPDILSRIRPVLASLIPRRPADDRVTELKSWVRFVVTGYVLVVVPVLILLFIIMIAHAPRAFATAYDSLTVRYERVGPELRAGRTPQAVMDIFQMVVLTLPCIGMVYTTSRVGHRAGTGAWTWSAGSLWRRLPLVAGTLATVAFVAFLWWPNGEYRPITPQDKGTLIGAARSLGSVPTGRPALSEPAAQQDREAAAQRDGTGRSAADARRSGDGRSGGSPDATGTTMRGGAGSPTDAGPDAPVASPDATSVPVQTPAGSPATPGSSAGPQSGQSPAPGSAPSSTPPASAPAPGSSTPTRTTPAGTPPAATTPTTTSTTPATTTTPANTTPAATPPATTTPAATTPTSTTPTTTTTTP